MSASDPRSEYLRHRFDQYRLKRRRPKWMVEIRSVCSPDAKESDFLPGDEAEALRQAFYQKLKSKVGIHAASYEANEYRKVIDLLRGIGERFHDERGVLIETGVGAIEAPIRNVLLNADSVWNPAEYDLCLVTRNMSHGLCAERDYHQESGPLHDKPYYGLRAWGDFVSANTPKE